MENIGTLLMARVHGGSKSIVMKKVIHGTVHNIVEQRYHNLSEIRYYNMI
jgi:hypothetical protein